jgi:hypothetical protein
MTCDSVKVTMGQTEATFTTERAILEEQNFPTAQNYNQGEIKSRLK